jgi:hypothetical protein
MKENLSCTCSFGKSKDEHMKRELHSSGLLFIESWQFLTDVSGQSIGHILRVKNPKEKASCLIMGLIWGRVWLMVSSH